MAAISGLTGDTYEERLAEVGLEKLEQRYDTLDMVQTFKIVNGIDQVEKDHWFRFRQEAGGHGTRAAQGGLSIIGQRSRLELRRHFFSQRVVEPWNKLPLAAKQSKTVGEFRWRLKAFNQQSH